MTSTNFSCDKILELYERNVEGEMSWQLYLMLKSEDVQGPTGAKLLDYQCALNCLNLTT